jgi:hypothetical protein
MALTLRSPEYVDQLALLEQIIRATPLGYNVVVKEHPAMIGALSARRLKQLLKRYPQLKVLHPSTNNYDVLRATELVVSINSKSGAEALLLGKKVVVLGEAFYSTSHLVNKLNSLSDLKNQVLPLLQLTNPDSKNEVIDYFHTVWNSSLPGELYITDDARVALFSNGLIHAVNAHESIHSQPDSMLRVQRSHG